MSKAPTIIALASIANQTTATNTINTNEAALAAAFSNTLSRDGSAPNQMIAALDMNSQPIINLPKPLTAGEPLRLADLPGPVPVLTAISGFGSSLVNTANALAAKTLLGFNTVNVKDSGAVGDGVADDTAAIQAAIFVAFGTVASPHGTNYTLNRELYFPAGTYKITAPLIIPNVQGPVIRGDGRFMTTISNTAGTGVFVTNGFEYGQVRGLQLSCTGTTAKVFDLNWDGSTGVALQSNTFSDMFFNGGGVGVEIGAAGFMGSENLFINCFWINHTTAGLRLNNFNALQNTVIGGNFQSCGTGIVMNAGTVCVYSTGFQVSTTADIATFNSANDAIVLFGCRSESVNFFSGAGGTSICVIGCTQLNASAGTFVSQNGAAHISGCRSINGKVTATGGQSLSGTVSACIFGRDDWLDASFAVSVTATNVKAATKYIGNQTFTNTTGITNAAPYYNNYIDVSSNLPTTVAGLATLITAGAGTGSKAFVSDANAAFTAGIGTIVAGGGTNKVPVFYNGTNWLIG